MQRLTNGKFIRLTAEGRTSLSLDPTSITLGAVVGGAVIGVAVYALGHRTSSVRPSSKPSTALLASSDETLFGRSLVPSSIESARREMRLLKMEKEYLSGALTRVYEAEVQGKITKDEMQYLSQKYRTELHAVEEKLNKAQMVVEVADLENAKEELLSLVNTKVAQIDARLKDLRTKVGVELPALEKVIEPVKEEKKERMGEAKKEKPPVMDEKLKKVVDDISEAMAKLEQMDMEQ